MKKVLIATNIILSTIIFFFACNPGKPAADLKPVKTIGIAVKGQGKDTRGIIQDSLAIIMSNLYNDDVSKSAVRGDAARPDTRSIWFSLETLKSFISNIETAIDTGKNFSIPLGTRIYFSKYQQKLDTEKYPELADLDKSVVGRHTIFFVPTYYDTVKKRNVDFNYNVLGTNRNQYPMPYSEVIARKLSPSKGAILGIDRSVYVYVGPNSNQYALTGDEVIQNHGGMCPPPAGSSCTFPSGN